MTADNRRMGSEPAGITRAGWMFHQLITYLRKGDEQRGRKPLTQKEIADIIGCHQTLISKWERPQNNLRGGLTDVIILGVMNGFRVSPELLFVEHAPDADIGDLVNNVYSLDKARVSATEREMRKAVVSLQNQLADQGKQLAELTRLVAEMTRNRRAK